MTMINEQMTAAADARNSLLAKKNEERQSSALNRERLIRELLRATEWRSKSGAGSFPRASGQESIPSELLLHYLTPFPDGRFPSVLELVTRHLEPTPEPEPEPELGPVQTQVPAPVQPPPHSTTRTSSSANPTNDRANNRPEQNMEHTPARPKFDPLRPLHTPARASPTAAAFKDPMFPPYNRTRTNNQPLGSLDSAKTNRLQNWACTSGHISASIIGHPDSAEDKFNTAPPPNTSLRDHQNTFGLFTLSIESGLSQCSSAEKFAPAPSAETMWNPNASIPISPPLTEGQYAGYPTPLLISLSPGVTSGTVPSYLPSPGKHLIDTHKEDNAKPIRPPFQPSEGQSYIISDPPRLMEAAAPVLRRSCPEPMDEYLPGAVLSPSPIIGHFATTDIIMSITTGRPLIFRYDTTYPPDILKLMQDGRYGMQRLHRIADQYIVLLARIDVPFEDMLPKSRTKSTRWRHLPNQPRDYNLEVYGPGMLEAKRGAIKLLRI